MKYKLLITTHTCTLKCTLFKQLTLIHWVLNSSLCTPNSTSLFLLITRFFSHPIVSRWWSQRGNAFEQTIWSPALWVWYNSVSSDLQKSKLDSEFPLSLVFLCQTVRLTFLSVVLLFSVHVYSFSYSFSYSCFFFVILSQRFGGQWKILLVWNVCFLGYISLSSSMLLQFLWIKQIFAASGFNSIQGFERKFILSQ